MRVSIHECWLFGLNQMAIVCRAPHHESKLMNSTYKQLEPSVLALETHTLVCYLNGSVERGIWTF